jgi:putative hemolysin
MLQPRAALSVDFNRSQPGWEAEFRRAITKVADTALGLNKLSDYYLSIPAAANAAQFVNFAVENLGVATRLAGAGVESIPEKGPAIVVANHPYGGLDGLLLAQLLLKRRPDVRILTNRLLSVIPELREIFISVDVFGRKGGMRENISGLRKALRWVESGGMLAMFPSGEVAHLKVDAGGIIDPIWPDSVARIVRKSRAPVTPIYFSGRNSWAFQIAGLVHPLLRTALLPRELLNKSGSQIVISIGKTMNPARIAGIEENHVLASHLRLQTYALVEAAQPRARVGAAPRDLVAVAPPANKNLLAAQVVSLAAAQRLAVSGDLAVFVTSKSRTPIIVEEIGRLREATFRHVGEGTGRSTDLDRYDEYYEHLFIWSESKREIAGAYRLGRSDEIIARSGLVGIYTQTLFRYSSAFFEQLRPALELGRSFVREEYQRSFAPLLLLWRGIAGYVARNPRYTVLFGAVSISNDYHPLSKEFLRDYLVREHYAKRLASCVKPRHKVRRKFSLKTLMHPWSGPRSIDSLGQVIGSLEADGKGIPVLLRQYLKLGGKIAGFNIDPDFSDSIDCLLVVDLCQTDPRVLEKYMGKSEAVGFLQSNTRGQQALTAKPNDHWSFISLSRRHR